MAELIGLDFWSRNVQRRSLGRSEVRDCLRKYLVTESFENAQKLCRKVFPTSEFYSSQRTPDGSWIATIRFDNLLHDGEGPTEASALVDAIVRIAEMLDLHEG